MPRPWRLRIGSILGLRLKIKVYRFADILKSLLFGLALRPTALERRNVGDKVAVFARFNDDLDVHGFEIIILLTIDVNVSDDDSVLVILGSLKVIVARCL